MNSASLNKALDEIIKLLDKIDINQRDKIELMINLHNFLDEKRYGDNVKILQQYNTYKRR